jgi:5-methylcytosine-specific restriction enzyme A
MSDRALERPLRFCRQAGCTSKTRNENGYCDAHQKDNHTRLYERLRGQDEVNKLYHREPWTSFRLAFLAQNPICQKLINGLQCDRPATLVHHLRSPRNFPDGFVDPENVAALCVACHPPSEGTETWRAGVDFVKTVFKLPNFGAKQ